MINNADIQTAWISKLKATATLTARVPATEIRENQWMGQTFSYPAVRVKLGPLAPVVQNINCNNWRSEVAILVFTEQKSSRTADEIAGIIATAFWKHPFSSGGVSLYSIDLASLVPAYVPEYDTNCWVSEVNFTCLVQST